MSRTTKFREQHVELLALAKEIAPLLNSAGMERDAEKVRHLLSQLAGKLNIHLAMEDNSLYPELLRHANPEIQSKAKAFVDEMGGIKKAFGEYLAKYPSAPAIQASAEGFAKDTQALFAVLGKRIEAEDSVLYPMLDSLG